MIEEQFKKKRDFEICGVVGVCATTREEFVKQVFSLPSNNKSSTVCLVGVPAVISAKENEAIANVYNTCTIAAIDGMPIVKIGKKLGFECERCAAPDIMGLMFEESIRQNRTHYFYGGKNDSVLFDLKKNLERDFPGIKIVGMYSPPFRPLTKEEDEFICNEINSLKPDFLWVGIGAPKQEIWMHNHVDKLKNVTMLGVGAGFDFIAGTLAKAPKWMEEMGVEWLFRLLKEPKRLFRRYVIGGGKWLLYSAKNKPKRL